MSYRASWMWIALAALVGCKSEINPAYCAAHPTDTRCPMTDGGGIDAMVDAPAPQIDAPSTCVGAGNYTVCLDTELPTSPATVPTTVDTDSQVTCLHLQPVGWVENGQPPACFIAGTTVSISSGVAAHGSRPLVIVATDTLTLSALLEAAGKRDTPTPIPAGYNAAACPAFTTAPVASATGGGGAAGGSFMTFSGNGAPGDNSTNAGGVAAGASSAPLVLRAGCGGQTGADGDTAGNGAPGGNGGGSIYLVAGNTLVLTATAQINVSGGGGGSTGGHFSGGGGGGSGGMLVLYAPTFTITAGAKLAANGGGGGAGDTSMNTTNATRGADGSVSSPTVQANGGTGPGGAGGKGFAVGNTAQAGTTGVAGAGGGGGGGSSGYVQANHALNNAVVSPNEIVVP